MEPEMTCKSNDTTEKMKLYMAMELSQKEWKLGFSVGPRCVVVSDHDTMLTEGLIATMRISSVITRRDYYVFSRHLLRCLIVTKQPMAAGGRLS